MIQDFKGTLLLLFLSEMTLTSHIIGIEAFIESYNLYLLCFIKIKYSLFLKTKCNIQNHMVKSKYPKQIPQIKTIYCTCINKNRPGMLERKLSINLLNTCHALSPTHWAIIKKKEYVAVNHEHGSSQLFNQEETELKLQTENRILILVCGVNIFLSINQTPNHHLSQFPIA